MPGCPQCHRPLTLALSASFVSGRFDLYGSTAAFASSLLFSLSPNLIAHGTLATTDIISIWRDRVDVLLPTLHSPTHTGVKACLSALTLVWTAHQVLCYLFVLSGRLFSSASACFLPPSRGPGTHLTRKSVAIYAGLAAICFLVVMNLGFSFDRTFTPLGEYRFLSPSFDRLRSLPVLRSVPVPVPYPFLLGLGHDEEQ